MPTLNERIVMNAKRELERKCLGCGHALWQHLRTYEPVHAFGGGGGALIVGTREDRGRCLVRLDGGQPCACGGFVPFPRYALHEGSSVRLGKDRE